MVRLIFHPEAKNELREAASFYEDKRQGLGWGFLIEVREIAAKIRQNPLRCSFVSPSYRCCRARRFPYGMIFFKRKPGYWKRRTPSDVGWAQPTKGGSAALSARPPWASGVATGGAAGQGCPPAHRLETEPRPRAYPFGLRPLPFRVSLAP